MRDYVPTCTTIQVHPTKQHATKGPPVPGFVLSNNQMATTNEEGLEALERAVAEICVFESMYRCDEEGETSAFRVVSRDALDQAHSILSGEPNLPIPRLDVERSFPLRFDNGKRIGLLHVGMPAGYPIRTAAIVSVEVPGWKRSEQDDVTTELNGLAKDLIGGESFMEVGIKFQDILDFALAESETLPEQDEPDTEPVFFCRQWLFMDHIKAESRRTQMIREATSLSVGGLIKPGYPGVCVVEGESIQVGQFVSWMKQIWIGRVAIRGEVALTGDDSLRKLPSQLSDLGNGKNLPNMGVLGAACREAGLEEEFLEYIMQIKQS